MCLGMQNQEDKLYSLLLLHHQMYLKINQVKLVNKRNFCATTWTILLGLGTCNERGQFCYEIILQTDT